MTRLTTTVTVNPAFLAEIKDDHVELSADLAALDAAFRRPRTSPAETARMLASLRERLAMHFSLEETYGYIDDPIDADPHITRRAEQLRAQHAALAARLAEIAALAGQIPRQQPPRRALDRLALMFRAFADQLLEHESQERDLVRQALRQSAADDDANPCLAP